MILMNQLNNLLLMTEESAMADAVACAMGRNGDFAKQNVCATLEELAARLEPLSPAIVIVDIDRKPDRILSELERLVRRYSKTRFIVLASDRKDDLILEAMQIGARHFLLKTSIAAELRGVLDRLTQLGFVESRESGTLITVLSGGGGCGATTLTVNLANELCTDGSDSALVVDLDAAYGAVTSFLGLRGKYGIPEILSDRARIDSELVRSTALTYSNHLHAVINPVGREMENSEPIAYENLDAALDVFKQMYAFTVVDAPRLATNVIATLVDASDIVLLPFQLLVKDIRYVRAMLATLRAVCASASHIELVATRYRKRRMMVSLREAALALDGAQLTCLVSDFASASKAINFGQPLAQAAPSSRLHRDIAQLALNMKNKQRQRQTSGGYAS